MSHSLYVFFCPQCIALTEIESITDQWLDGKPISGHYACVECGASCGIWMDGGMIDLDDVRASVDASSKDFEVFG